MRAKSSTTSGVSVSAMLELYLMCCVNRMPVSLAGERKTSNGITNKNQLQLANQSYVVQLRLTVNRGPGL